MADRRILACDACGAETDMRKSDGWLQVRTYIASEGFMDHVQEMRFAGLDDGTNHGDFCSLLCVANWAGAQDALRELRDDDEYTDDE